MTKDERDRILMALFARDRSLSEAGHRIDELHLNGNISAREFLQARERVEDLRDEIIVRVHMVIDDISIVQPPTQEEVDALKANLKDLETQIAASAAVEEILKIAAEVAEKAA